MPKAPTKSPARSQPSPRKPKQSGPAPYKAFIKTLAIQSSAAIAAIDPSVLGRIKKCYQKANHVGTGEAEAKAAILLATRLIASNNVTLAEVMDHETSDDRQKRAGESVVTIRSTAESKDGKLRSVREQGFMIPMAVAMNGFFDCMGYITKPRDSIDFVFYGLGPNTVAAAQAFEMVFNLSAEWAREVKGNSGKYAYG